MLHIFTYNTIITKMTLKASEASKKIYNLCTDKGEFIGAIIGKSSYFIKTSVVMKWTP